ncbi:cbb3-type cytochrome oxidase assembly protein CcoS [Albibacterium sp.]|uniref:cbb3-type cytochrome oxidase assembly protein CcoS n=1 Tax=Albibacterium sp. TaxID=2952885 RepID=UPI002C19C2DC|nr:cbb3-type cytochrome oxidase assembly protein CcoS [Albibacterium sp.]HUH19137.1 cbb3-type cytochrome oxidase assembly protein CcoS [Albibacterium sp.]
MEMIYFLIGCSVFIALVFLGAFIWANKTGQHDDTHTPAIRILFDDEEPKSSDTESSTQLND